MASSILQMLKRFAMFVLVVGLAGAVLWLMSERHARIWAIEQRDNNLWIVRGRQLPFGFLPYRPGDKALEQAYRPLPLLGDSPAELLTSTFDDRDDLDRALFRVIRSWAEVRVDSDDPERLNQALQMLKRADLLPGIDSKQRQELKDLQAKVAYVEGRLRLKDAEEALREGVSRLKSAAEARGRYAREAGELFERVNSISEQLSRNLRIPLTVHEMDLEGRKQSGSATAPEKLPAPALFAPQSGSGQPGSRIDGGNTGKSAGSSSLSGSSSSGLSSSSLER